MEGNLVDRISMLDNNTLNHILSLTDTKSAVRTSALSKKWVGLWKDQHKLEFYSSMFPTDLSFFAFVNKVLQDRNSAIKIDSIKVVYNGGSASFPDQVSNWLHAASEAEAAEIIISSRQERDCVVPVQVFSNPRLKYLDLDLHCRISIPTPDQLDLPEVTHVKIRNTNFDQPDLGLDLTSNSPKLEYLDFGHIQTRGDGINITVISQSLRDLKVKIRYGVGDLYRPSMMNVHAPAMSSLVSYCVDKLVLQDVSALQSADVAVIKPNLPVAKHNLQFLQQMVGVKDMRISFFPTSQVTTCLQI
ncbi:F-box/FBD/LRR-repeat protein At1g16930-like [Papaver somniferum]|uniref:F-box/FBD/LRR-repeat protein At1g16930-like n=1 Tax=Papaver somniferum TaxID=3469 RepID=UPI000E7055FE|nr:F-box/FBD/LRR-repeat protein At1g16930-like [Papaver somniferum]